MRGDRYKVRQAILGVVSDEQQDITPIALPRGNILEVLSEDTNNRLVDIIWEGRSVMIFNPDLRNRCDLITAGT